MALFSFYKVRKPRQFRYNPVCWDPRKEALEERIEKVKRDIGAMNDHPEDYKPAIKGRFIESTSHLRKSRKRGEDIRSRSNKNVWLILSLVLLGVIFWYFFIK